MSDPATVTGRTPCHPEDQQPSDRRRPRRAGRSARVRLAHMAVAVFLALAGLTVSTAAPAHAATASPAATAIGYALNQLGDPYQWGATGPSSYDCSGLTQAAYASAGISIPRVARDQYHNLTKVPLGSLQAGDLVFWATDTGDWTTVHHVGIYLSPGWMLHAPYTGSTVRIAPMSTSGLMPYGVRPAPGYTALLSIERGSVGDDVRDLQTRLRANGYGVSVDGDYGPATYAAVHDFQLRVGLYGTGLVGPSTWANLVSRGVHTWRS